MYFIFYILPYIVITAHVQHKHHQYLLSQAQMEIFLWLYSIHQSLIVVTLTYFYWWTDNHSENIPWWKLEELPHTQDNL